MRARVSRERREAAITVRLRQSLKDDLQALAHADRRPLAGYLEVLLEDHVTARKSEISKPSTRRR